MTSPRNLWLTGALALAIAAPAFGQVVRERTTVRSGASTTTSTSVVKLSKVMKSKVVTQDDDPAGQIVDIVISDAGCVDYYVAAYEDEYYVIPYSAIVWRDNAVFVDITPAQFKKIEFFASNNWPDLTSTTYQKQVFSTFGVSSLRQEGQRSTFKQDTSDRRDDRQDARDDRRDDAKDQAKDRKDTREDRRDDAKDQAKDRKDTREDRRDDAKENAEDRRENRDADKPREKDAPKPDAKKPSDSDKPKPGATDPTKKPAPSDKSPAKPGTVPKRDGADKPSDKKPAPLPNPPKPSEKDPK